MNNQEHSLQQQSELLARIIRNFQFCGKLVFAAPYGTGHINSTFCVGFEQAGRLRRYILQSINSAVFKNPVAVMQNIERVTAQLAVREARQEDLSRRVLSLIATHQEKFWHLDENGNCWRAYHFIEGASTFDAIQSANQAFQAARAFGYFQRNLVDLSAPPLHTTIRDFHNTPKRFVAFQNALQSDLKNRAVNATREVASAYQFSSLSSVLLDANLPERVCHNDTKLSNVMLDDATGEGLCVIDLDTVMPGLVLYDFGDMVRTTTSPALEDEVDLSKVAMQLPLFEAILRGYLSAAGSFLTKAEQNLLVASTKLITYEQALRFLTDYLAGDPYYKTRYAEHNLARCRTQLKLLESIASQEEKMMALVESATTETAHDEAHRPKTLNAEFR